MKGTLRGSRNEEEPRKKRDSLIIEVMEDLLHFTKTFKMLRLLKSTKKQSISYIMVNTI